MCAAITPPRAPTKEVPVTAAIPRLVCFPHAGGSTLTYYSWRSALAGRYEVCIVDPPGRVGSPTDPPVGTMDELVAAVAQRAEPFLRPPYVLYGHSLGALLAFETARRIAAPSAGPELLVVSGRNGPNERSAAGDIHWLPDRELVDAIDRLDRSMPPLRDNPDLAELFLPVLRADLTLAETYAYRDGRPLSCPILSIQGEDDPVLTRPGVATWAAQTTGRCTFRWMPGEHLFHLQGTRFISQLPGLISEALSSPA
jgi:surfactin synthase thioesterase subunit